MVEDGWRMLIVANPGNPLRSRGGLVLMVDRAMGEGRGLIDERAVHLLVNIEGGGVTLVPRAACWLR